MTRSSGVLLLAGILVGFAAAARAQTPRTFPDQRLAEPVNNRPTGPYTRVHPWSELPYDAEVYDNRASVIGIGEGSETNIPLARAVIGGLLVSTFMTLLFVPVLHAIARRRSAPQLAEMGPRPWPQRHKGSHAV